jgi:hypothetical protein
MVTRRGFFAGLVGAVGAVVGLKALQPESMEEWEVALEVGPSFESTRHQQYAELYAKHLADVEKNLLEMSGVYDGPALKSGKAIMAMHERAPAPFPFATRLPLPDDDWYEPMAPEIRDAMRMRDYLDRHIREFYLMHAYAPIVYITREEAEAAYNGTGPKVSWPNVVPTPEPGLWVDFFGVERVTGAWGGERGLPRYFVPTEGNPAGDTFERIVIDGVPDAKTIINRSAGSRARAQAEYHAARPALTVNRLQPLIDKAIASLPKPPPPTPEMLVLSELLNQYDWSDVARLERQMVAGRP